MNAAPAASRSPSLTVRGALAVALAVLANVALVFVAEALAVAPDFRALTVPPVAFLSAVGAGGATVVYWLFGRFFGDAERVFVRVAAGVLLVSFVPDLALLAVDPTATPLAVVLLMAMHVVVAAAAVGALVYWRADR
ncbi:DUF6069 family protein [Halorubrum sp. AD140]|uniref:DUF6069 family protein n=1 Tax=Halorubrum sp. AD140 TaxID=3050073 RepID=UPI002ACC60EC|nr:DUF6069 family protein [Halorubrum sp. AD140]MDZ5811304.1 DUF6069 family protein [Halorubrum sp. AD140]